LVTDCSLPSVSVAVTVKSCSPSVEVSIGWPSSTVPTQVATTGPPGASGQEKSAWTVAPRAYVAPSAGVVIVTTSSEPSSTS
jgi:hypothetical protein